MATLIFPSVNDIGATAGDGDIGNDVNTSKWGENLRAITSLANATVQVGRGAVIGGWEYLFDSGLTATLANGLAQIEGYRIEEDALVVVTLTASKHNHVYLKLDKTGDKVTGAQYAINATNTFDDLGTPPTDSILLWSFQTDGSSVVAKRDYRTFGNGNIVGRYVGNGLTGDRDIILGYKPKFVMVVKTSFPRIWAFSEIGYPLAAGQNGGLLVVQRAVDEPVHAAFSASSRLRPSLKEGGAGFSVQAISGGQTVELPPKIEREQFTFDPPSILFGDDRNDDFGSFDIDYLKRGEPIYIGHDQITFQDIQITAWARRLFPVVANGITVRLFNHATSGSINIASGTLTAAWFEADDQAELKVDLNTTGEIYHFVAFS